MFDLVRAIHDAFHIETTWGFALLIAAFFAAGAGLIGGGTGYIVDRAYRNAQAVDAARFQPLSMGIAPVAVNIPRGVAPPPMPLFQIQIAMRNPKPNAARGIRGRLVVAAATLDAAPSIDTEFDNGDTETHTFQLNAPINVGGDVPPCLVAFEMRYQDAVTRLPVRQVWHWTWPGSERGYFQDRFANASTQDAQRFAKYLSARLKWPKDITP